MGRTDNVGRGGQVQSESASLEGNQKHGAVFDGLKFPHQLAAIFRRARQIKMRPAASQVPESRPGATRRLLLRFERILVRSFDRRNFGDGERNRATSGP